MSLAIPSVAQRREPNAIGIRYLITRFLSSRFFRCCMKLRQQEMLHGDAANPYTIPIPLIVLARIIRTKVSILRCKQGSLIYGKSQIRLHSMKAPVF